jgi:hypothetical protein
LSTFLELVNETGAQSGTVSGALTTVANATGRWGRVVSWVREGWRMVQTSRSDWTFRDGEFSSPLTAGVGVFSASVLDIDDFGMWPRVRESIQPFTIYDPALGRGDETRLNLMPLDRWRDTYDRGEVAQNRPCAVAVHGNRALAFGPTPDKAYVVRGTYITAVQRLTDDDDVPLINPDLHDIIKWRALMLLAEFDEAPFPLGAATTNYRELLAQMHREYLPEVEVG